MPTDSPDWLRALRADLTHVAEEGALAVRLAAVQEHLDRWADGDDEAGSLAADALDQLEGLCAELAATFGRLRDTLPVVLDELPRSRE